MATAKHGKKGRLILDMTPDGEGIPVHVPMLVTWSTDHTRDKLDTTSCDSQNKESVAGFGDYKLTFEVNMDADSDLLFEACDGKPRMHYLYPDRDAGAGTMRQNYGLITLSISESGGVSAKLGQSVTAEASGPIHRGFA